MDSFGFKKIGFGTIFSESDWVVVWPVCRAIEMNYFIGFDLRNREDLMKLSEEFAAICESSREVRVGVGWLSEFNPPICLISVKWTKFCTSETGKRVWGIVVLAGCDARGIFHMWNCMNTGSNNDCTAWDKSKLKELVESGMFLKNFT